MTYKVNNILYAAGPDLLGTLRMAIILTEPVDPEVLAGAAAKAIRRFPYFAVRLVRDGDKYIYESNPLPFVVSPEGKAVVLGSEESNYHMFAFAYDGCRMYIDTTHFMTDGNGIFQFLRTLLYYYITGIHPDAEIVVENIALADSEIPLDESDDDPYPEEALPVASFGIIERPEELFTLDMPNGYDTMSSWRAFRFRIKQKDMMSFVSGVDGSPATFITTLMYKAILACHPDEHLPLVCGMQHQFRGAVGRRHSHLCHVNIVPMIYPDKLRDRPIDVLNTIGRGILITQADDLNDVLTVNAHILNEKAIKYMTIPEKHDYMRRVVLDGIGKNTFEVSYTGYVRWCGLEKYIVDVIPLLDMALSGGISIEIFSIEENFSVCIMQRNADPKYTDQFAAILKENGIPFEADPPEGFELCGFALPE